MPSTLPALPLPSLEQSISSILRATEPLVPQVDFPPIKDSIQSLESNKLLNILQSHLKEYHDTHKCYLDLFSNVRDHNATNIYSEYRGKTLPKNPYFILENDPGFWSLKPPTQAERAAILTFSTLKFIAAIRMGSLKPDIAPSSGEPLSMKSYGYLFGSTRYPSAHGHGINIKHTPDSHHIVVLCKGRFYYLEVLNDKNEVLVDQSGLQRLFEFIIHDFQSEVSVCSMTSETRENWAKLRLLLEENSQNANNLKLVDSALVVVNLDVNKFILNDADLDYSDICHGTSQINQNGVQMGSCVSRWYDKLQLIVAADGLAAVLWEPTSNDATVVLRYVSDIYTDSILRLARNIMDSKLFSLWPNVVVTAQYDFTHVEECKYFYSLDWDFANQPKLLHRLHLAETRMGDLLCQFEETTEILGYGRTFAEKIELNMDSLIQLVIQISHYALYGRMVCTCESVSTRRFENSRSELCYIQSNLIMKICQGFISNNAWKKDMVKQGVEQITSFKRACRDGQGFEKHLKALKLAYLQRNYLNEIKSPNLERIPEPDEIKDIPRFLLESTEATSYLRFVFDPEILAINCGNPSLKAFGITPYSPNGFGIGYVIKEEGTVVSISSNFRQNKRFLSTMKWVLGEIAKAFEAHDITAGSSVAVSTAEMLRTVSMTLTDSSNHENHEEDLDEDHILGGYGYFDVGEIEYRSISGSGQVSRVESTSNLQFAR